MFPIQGSGQTIKVLANEIEMHTHCRLVEIMLQISFIILF